MSEQPDTTPLMTPYEVERKLFHLSHDLDAATEDLVEAESEWVLAKESLNQALARARVNIAKEYANASPKFTVQEKDDMALLACPDESTRAAAAEIWVRGTRAQVNNLRSQVDIIRSIGTSVRASMDMA